MFMRLNFDNIFIFDVQKFIPLGQMGRCHPSSILTWVKKLVFIYFTQIYTNLLETYIFANFNISILSLLILNFWNNFLINMCIFRFYSFISRMILYLKFPKIITIFLKIYYVYLLLIVYNLYYVKLLFSSNLRSFTSKIIIPSLGCPK